MKSTISTILLSGFLLCPVSLLADRNNHQWSDQEQPYWHQYLQEHHKKDRDWEHASARQKRNYWKWRDQHHDDHNDRDRRDHDHHDDNH